MLVLFFVVVLPTYFYYILYLSKESKNTSLYFNFYQKNIYQGVNQFHQFDNSSVVLMKNSNNNSTFTSSRYVHHIVHDYVRKEPYKLLVMVSTSADHYGRRKLIRKYWGNKKILEKESIKYPMKWKVIFVIGKSDEAVVNEEVLKEAKINHDVIIEDVNEHFYNMAKKVILVLTGQLVILTMSSY